MGLFSKACCGSKEILRQQKLILYKTKAAALTIEIAQLTKDLDKWFASYDAAVKEKNNEKKGNARRLITNCTIQPEIAKNDHERYSRPSSYDLLGDEE